VDIGSIQVPAEWCSKIWHLIFKKMSRKLTAFT
jgi:hypothetical protein